MNISAMLDAPKADKSAVTIRQNLTQVEAALSEFDKVNAGLQELAQRYPVDLVYDVTTGKGMVEAIAHRAAWRDPRLSVERLRKQAKAPVLALGKDIDARAAWLTEQLLMGEKPIDEQIKAEEQRKEDAKQARIAAEFGRVQAIQDAIAEIHMDAMTASSKPAAVIAEALVSMRARTLDPLVFQELMGQAEAARAAAVAKLDLAHKAAMHTEAEAARIAAERAELETLRREAAERTRLAGIEAAEQQARIATGQAAERARIAEQQAEIDRQRAELEAAQKAEAARSAAVLPPAIDAMHKLTPRQYDRAEVAHGAAAVQATSTLPPPPVGALTAGEIAILRAWAEDYAAACVAAERERCAAHRC